MEGREPGLATMEPKPPTEKKLKHHKRRTKRRNLNMTERMEEQDRERENQRLARQLRSVAPAIDNQNERTRAFQLKMERDNSRYTSGDRPILDRDSIDRLPLDAVQARETAQLPDVRSSIELPVAGPPSSVMHEDDERKELARALIQEEQLDIARQKAERVARSKLERARERSEQRAAARAMAKEREERDREVARRRVHERSEERKLAEEERAMKRKEAEDELFYQAQALKATLRSKTEVRSDRLQEDRNTVLIRKQRDHEQFERARRQFAEAEALRRQAAQADRSSRKAMFAVAKEAKDLTPAGPSSTIVSRSAARAVAKAVRDAELRAHEEMVQAHRQRLKEAGAPVMTGGRMSSTPRPSKGVTDWSRGLRSQTERGTKRSGSKASASETGAMTGRGENDADAVARLTALAGTLSGGGGGPSKDGVHDALAAELRAHGPLPPGVLTGLLGKQRASANAEGGAGTWPIASPRGAHTMEARDVRTQAILLLPVMRISYTPAHGWSSLTDCVCGSGRSAPRDRSAAGARWSGRVDRGGEPPSDPHLTSPAYPPPKCTHGLVTGIDDGRS